MDTTHLSPEQYAEIRRVAMKTAAQLRAQAIDGLFSAVGRWLRHGWYRLLQRCRLPHPEF